MSKVDRNFLNNNNVSKHLMCIICQDIFDDPKRINCGHTFCFECITKWMIENNQCPMCKTKIIKKQISRDLVALNIINDMNVTCNNLECPWKGVLSELTRHLKICPFDEKRISENIKKQLSKTSSMVEVKNSSYDEETITGDYLSFNPKNASLKARLFQKNPELIGKVLNEDEKEKKNLDILSLIGLENNKTINPYETENNINRNNDIQVNNTSNLVDKNRDNYQNNNIITSTENATDHNTNNMLSKKRNREQKRSSICNDSNSDINDINDSKCDINSMSSLDENEKRELEIVLGMSLKEFRDKVNEENGLFESN